MGESRTTGGVMSGALFREIHKNAWLKRLGAPDSKKVGVIPKKADRVWIVFCVHDDNEAFLEGYSNSKVATTHVPDWFVCLNNTLHISPSICPRQQEYEFVITLRQEVLRLTAPTWESMQEWVEALRTKLREMRILSPNENLYSKMPEIKPLLLPTRDPMSPLPAPPPVPAILVPGIEPISNGSMINSANNAQTYPISRHVTSASVNDEESSELNLDNTVIDEITVQNDMIPSENSMEVRTFHLENNDCIGNDDKTLAATFPCARINEVQTSISFVDTSLNVCDSKSATLINSVSKKPVTNVGSNITILNTPGSSSDPIYFSSGSNSLMIMDTNMNSNQDVEGHMNNHDRDNAIKNYESLVCDQQNEASDNNVQLSLKNMTSLFVADSSKADRQLQCNIENNFTTRLYQDLTNIETFSSEICSSEQSPNIANSNITIIQVSNPPHTAIPVPSNYNVFRFNFHTEEKRENFNTNNKKISNILSLQNNTAGICSLNFDSEIDELKTDFSKTSLDINLTEVSNLEASNDSEYKIECSNDSSDANISMIENSCNNDNTNTIPITGNNINREHYEKIFLPSTSRNFPVNIVSRIPPKSPKFSLLSKQQRSISHNELQINRNRVHNDSHHSNSQRINELSEQRMGANVTNINISKCRNLEQKSNASTENSETPCGIPMHHILTRGLTELQITRSKHLSRLHNNGANVHMTTNDQIQNPVKNRLPMNGERRRRSLSNSETGHNDIGHAQENQGNTVPGRLVVQERGPNNPVNNIVRLTLREQQVMQLRQEMSHPGGVRLTLRKKDCSGSIALVDALGLVWIAGWKQRQHPMLYNALHIGDHVMSVASIPVNSASDAVKAIRAAVGIYIEFIVRRVPYGRVYAIHKETEGQPLGIIRDSNTSTIVDIIPNSLAARHGIPPKAQTCDGLSLTSWVLTEINGRPLNLFFKDNEVRDRLNAVGRDISILIQPLDLMKQLKKQLKNLRGYKEYIVQ